MSHLKNTILSKIEKEKITPIPKSYFINKYRIFWGIFWISIILGILWTAFFIEDSSEFIGMFGYLEWNIGIFLLPNIFWIILIIFLVFIGIKSLRNTSVGYRYSYWKITIIWVIIIVSWWYLFRFSGLWPMLHTFMRSNIPWIESLLYTISAWNSPENGRLSGIILEKTKHSIQLKSTDEKIWNIDIDSSFISPKVVWNTGEQIRILWELKWNLLFKANKIMPWFWKGMGNGWSYLKK